MFKKTAQDIGKEVAKSAISTAKDVAKNDLNDAIRSVTPILGILALYICFNRKESLKSIDLQEFGKVYFF